MSKNIKWLAIITIIVAVIALVLNVFGKTNGAMQVLSNILTVVLAGVLLGQKKA